MALNSLRLKCVLSLVLWCEGYGESGSVRIWLYAYANLRELRDGQGSALIACFATRFHQRLDDYFPLRIPDFKGPQGGVHKDHQNWVPILIGLNCTKALYVGTLGIANRTGLDLIPAAGFVGGVMARDGCSDEGQTGKSGRFVFADLASDSEGFARQAIVVGCCLFCSDQNFLEVVRVRYVLNHVCPPARIGSCADFVSWFVRGLGTQLHPTHRRGRRNHSYPRGRVRWTTTSIPSG